MKVTLKLYATLGQYLPSGASNNEVEVNLSGGETVLDVLKQHSVPLESCHLVLVNGSYVEPSVRGEHVLEDNDHLAAWPPVAGG
jgi:sulfur carrier protein ThiS